MEEGLTTVKAAVQYVIDRLPSSPIRLIDTTVLKQYLGFINWFIPVGHMLDIFLAFLGAYGVWLGVSAVMRKFNLIG